MVDGAGMSVADGWLACLLLACWPCMLCGIAMQASGPGPGRGYIYCALCKHGQAVPGPAVYLHACMRCSCTREAGLMHAGDACIHRAACIAALRTLAAVCSD